MQDKNIILTLKKNIQDMNNMVAHLRLLSEQIIQKQKILFTFHKIRFMGHLILGSLVQLCPICVCGIHLRPECHPCPCHAIQNWWWYHAQRYGQWMFQGCWSADPKQPYGHPPRPTPQSQSQCRQMHNCNVQGVFYLCPCHSWQEMPATLLGWFPSTDGTDPEPTTIFPTRHNKFCQQRSHRAPKD